jgi:hypothetical protein
MFELHHKPHTLSLSPITPTVALRVGTAVSRPRQDWRQSALRASRRPQWLQFHLQHALSAAVLTLIAARPVKWHTCFVKSSSSRCLSVGSTPSTRTPATSDVRQAKTVCRSSFFAASASGMFDFFKAAVALRRHAATHTISSSRRQFQQAAGGAPALHWHLRYWTGKCATGSLPPTSTLAGTGDRCAAGNVTGSASGQ